MFSRSADTLILREVPQSCKQRSWTMAMAIHGGSLESSCDTCWWSSSLHIWCQSIFIDPGARYRVGSCEKDVPWLVSIYLIDPSPEDAKWNNEEALWVIVSSYFCYRDAVSNRFARPICGGATPHYPQAVHVLHEGHHQMHLCQKAHLWHKAP